MENTIGVAETVRISISAMQVGGSERVFFLLIDPELMNKVVQERNSALEEHRSSDESESV